MAREYFGGAPTAVQGGFEFGRAQRARQQKENALNALIERFGPEAADPAAYAQLQGVQQQAELHPYVLGGVQRADAAQKAAVAQLGPAAGDPAAQDMVDSQQKTQRELQQRAALSAAVFLQGAAKRGVDPNTAFDRVAEILPAIGYPAEQIAGLREQFISDPDSVVAMLRSGDPNSVVRAVGQPTPVFDEASGKYKLLQAMTDGTTQLIEGVQPASTLQADQRIRQGDERLNQGWAKLSWDQVKQMLPAPQAGVQYWQTPDGRVVADVTPGSPQEAERDTAVAKQIGELSAAVQGAQLTVIAPAEVVQTNGSRVLDYMRQSGWNSGVLPSNVRAAQAKVRGTQAWEVAQMLETLKANIGFSQLSNMTRGLGAVSERELMQLESVLGRLTVDRDPQLLEADIQRVLQLHRDIVQKTNQAIERQQGQINRLQERGSFGPPQSRPATAEPSIDDLLNQYAPK